MSNPATSEELILVVDDEDDVRSVVVRYLTKRGYRVREASDGDSALAIIREASPSAIVSDICMPGHDGLQLLHEVLEVDPDVATILITGAPTMDFTIEALRAGATDFLPKPINFQQLESAIKRGLELRRRRLASKHRQQELEIQVTRRTREVSDTLKRLQITLHQLRESYEECIELLRRTSAIRDQDTGQHIDRIGLASAEVGRFLGLSEDEVQILRAASPMHDIGKLGIPDHILQKPGPLTKEEFELMKTHTTIGAQILGGRESQVLRASEIIALTHHEWWNGCGYPHGVQGEAIPLFGRIVAVVDVFDALTHRRCYKAAMTTEEAASILRKGQGTQFDPMVLEAFFMTLPRIVEINRKYSELEDLAETERLFAIPS